MGDPKAKIVAHLKSLGAHLYGIGDHTGKSVHNIGEHLHGAAGEFEKTEQELADAARSKVFRGTMDPLDGSANKGSGAHVRIGNFGAMVDNISPAEAAKLAKIEKDFPDDLPMVVLKKQPDFHGEFRGEFKTPGPSGPNTPALFGHQINDPINDELGRATIKARLINGDTSGVNYAAFKCYDENGKPYILVGHSEGVHSERVAGIPLVDSSTRVSDIFSERTPCDRKSSYCGTWLHEHLGDSNSGSAPDVRYHVLYDDTTKNYDVTKHVIKDAKHWLKHYG
ncbi:MAG: hypothetical protein HOV87_02105 [Catenulispora sp.]|nr:hypothetical protein [Catenulispora sp.]